MSDKNNIKEIFLAGVDRVLGYNAVIKHLEGNPISGNLNLVSILNELAILLQYLTIFNSNSYIINLTLSL